MTPIRVELSNVTYNAANQSFEARATLHDMGIRHSYACMIEGPIKMLIPEIGEAEILTRAADLIVSLPEASAQFHCIKQAGARQDHGRRPRIAFS